MQSYKLEGGELACLVNCKVLFVAVSSKYRSLIAILWDFLYNLFNMLREFFREIVFLR